MDTNIITTAELTINAPATFKNPKLETITNRICAIYSGAMQYAIDKNTEICKLLGQVKTERLYIEDGYKSVEEYAQAVLGIGRSSAYSKATYGALLNDKDAPPALKAIPQSNFSAIASIPMETLKEDLESGALKSDMTQAQLKEYAKSKAKKADKPTLAKTYEAYIVGHVYNPEIVWKHAGMAGRLPKDFGPGKWTQDMDETMPTFIKHEDGTYSVTAKHLTLDAWDAEIFAYMAKLEMVGNAEVCKLPKRVSRYSVKADTKPDTDRRLYIMGDASLVVEFYPHTVTPVSTLPKTGEPKKLTKAQLMAAIAELSGEDLNELLGAKLAK